MPDILAPRDGLRPLEYPQFKVLQQKLNHSHWWEFEYNFNEDVHQFHTELTDIEQEIIRRTLLAISQIEVSVKLFYAQTVTSWFPKPEICKMAITFAESEVRHEDAYSRLLVDLGMEDDFDHLMDIPAIADRVRYLSRYRKWQNSRSAEQFLKSLMLFGVYIEGASLMSQFLIMQSFNNYRSLLPQVFTVVNATSKEEQLHSQGAFELVRVLRDEHPEWFTPELEKMMRLQTKKAFDAESKVLDWIMEEGELDFMPRVFIDEFLKRSFNNGLENVGYQPEFDLDQTLLEEVEWFDVSMMQGVFVDFFKSRSTAYSMGKSFSEDDLFASS